MVSKVLARLEPAPWNWTMAADGCVRGERMPRMRIRTIMLAVALAAGFIQSDQVGLAQIAQTGQGKPAIKLLVDQRNLTIDRRAGSMSIVIDAAASDGFSGTIEGTISVSGVTNPSGVKLRAGQIGRGFPFKLTAGHKLSETGAFLTFTIETSPTNDESGTLSYTVAIDPSTQFTTIDSPTTVKVVTSP